MCKIMLSIKPQYAANILNGSKKFEYRKVRFKREVDKILIYSTHPVMSVVGEAKIEKILENTPQKIWDITKKLRCRFKIL